MSPDAEKVYKAFADGRPIKWGDLHKVLGYDNKKIARAWNELVAEGKAEGRISFGEQGRIVQAE